MHTVSRLASIVYDTVRSPEETIVMDEIEKIRSLVYWFRLSKVDP